jgi:murein DD-endopeptidase MepM/ murein hydrolase activator NlpD
LKRRRFLGGLAATVLCSATRAQEAPRLSIQGTAFQAYPLFVTLYGEVATPEVEFEGKRYRMVAIAGGWRAVVPISIDARGTQPLRVVSRGNVVAERSLSIKPRDYGMQYLSLNPSTLASYDDPQNKADDEAILAAMKEVDDSQLWHGNWELPCDAPESTGFGQRRLYNGWKKSWHKGLDLAGWEGQAVTAPAEGRVIHKARGLVNGNTLVLSHGLGVFSVYFHLSSFAVAMNQSVNMGQQIGAVGGTGGFAPHLHWETRCFGGPVHPKAFFHLPADWQ